MKIEGQYVDLALCRDNENAPVLAIAPRWSISADDLVDVAIAEKTYTLRVEHVCTVTGGDNVYTFVSEAYGGDPMNAVITQRYSPREISWKEYEEKEAEA